MPDTNPAAALLSETRDGAVAIITMNNPARRNALSMQMRREMLKDGSSPADADTAVAKILKANWPVRPPVQEWPYQYRIPRCVQCDGYGLVIRTVVNRLRCTVTEGTPCDCEAGKRYHDKPRQEEDFTAAGKATVKPKGFSRWNG